MLWATPMAETLAELIVAQARAHKDKTALLVPDSGEALSYRALAERAGWVARWLADQDVRPGQIVVLALPNSSAALQLLLGAAALGAVPIMLDPVLTRDDLEAFLGACRAALLIVDQEYWRGRADAQLGCGSLIVPSADQAWFDGFLTRARKLPVVPAAPKMPDALGLLIATSGTTGVPKAVCLTHAAFLSRCRRYRARLGTDETFTSLCCLPLAHSLYFCLSVLHDGGTLVLCPPFQPWRIEALWAEVARYRVRWMHLIPSIIRALVQLRDRHDPGDLSSLRFITSASAPIDSATIAAFERLYGVPLLNCYGLKETGLIAITPPDLTGRDLESVGHVDVAQTAILGADRGPLRPGELGEIAFRADTVTTGYYGLEQETRRAFHDGWFLTGDLGRIDPVGRLYVLGRCKDLIISNGRKIAPEEVDAALRRHESVLDSVTFGVPDSLCGERVVSCIVGRPGQQPAEGELQRHCRGLLADYKRPQRIEIVETLPQASTGKIRRQAARDRFAPLFA